MINYLRGEDKPFSILFQGATSKRPYDFTGATEIVISFPLTSTTTLDYKLSMSQIAYPVASLLGELAGTIAAADGENLAVGQSQLVLVEVTKPSGITKFQGNILNVNG